MIPGELTNLRAVERSDLGLLHRWLNDPELMSWWGIPEPAVSLGETERRIEEWLRDEADAGRPAAFIIERLDGEPAGLIILSMFEPIHASVELSMFVADSADRGRGIGGDALTTICGACFDQWRVHRVSLRVETHNERAIAFYERSGFTREGTLRDASYFNGAFHDQILYSLLATDGQPAK